MIGYILVLIMKSLKNYYFYLTKNYDQMKKLFFAILPMLLCGAVYAQEKTDKNDEEALRAEGRELHNDSRPCAPKLPNIIAVHPLQFTENGVAGVGVSYEHAFDPAGIVALYIPVVLDFNTSTSNPGYYGNNGSATYDPMFYVMPGIKIYPTGSFGVAKYAIGPNLVVADGRKTSGFYDPYYGGPWYNSDLDHFVLGMMINQSLNINPTPRLYLGTELGMGFSYLNEIGGNNQPTEFLVQFNFKIGYRF